VRFGGSDLHTLAGAYAMDAVSPPDRARFERHMARCEACRQEVRGLREATAALAAAAAVRPPDAFREAVLRQAGQVRQAPPAGARPPARWAALRRRELGWRPRLAVALAGVLAAVAVAGGVITYGMQDRIDQDQRRELTVAAVLTASDATMMTARVSTGGTATVVMSHRERALVFTAARLHALPAADGYELWLIGPAGTRAAGMIAAAGRGRMVGPVVVSGLAAGDSVRMTVEPAGGSARPTSSPVLVISLTGP